MKQQILFICIVIFGLVSCIFDPVPPTTTTSTTTTALDTPKTGDISVKKIPLKISRPFDYKIDSKGIGHLLVGERGYFRYQTFDGKAWSPIEILKDSKGNAIVYATKDTRFRAPHIAILKDVPYVVWGEKESDGMKITHKEGSSWNTPKAILGTQWIEYSNVDTFKDEIYLASVTVQGMLTFSKFNGTDFVPYKTMSHFNKEVNTYAGQDNLWFTSRFSNGFAYPSNNPESFITFRGASIPQIVVPSGTDYHVAYIAGDSRKLDGKQYYWPDKVVYKSQAKEIVIHDLPTPTDDVLRTWKTLSDGWLQVCGGVGISTVGGNVSVIYDIDNTLYIARVKGSTSESQMLGVGECPLVKQTMNRAEVITHGDFMHVLEVK